MLRHMKKQENVAFHQEKSSHQNQIQSLELAMTLNIKILLKYLKEFTGKNRYNKQRGTFQKRNF